MKFYNPFRILRETHELAESTHELVEQMDVRVARHGNAIRTLSVEFAELKTEQVSLRTELVNQLDVARNQSTGLQVLQAAMDMVGIRRKHGGNVDIDYDKFCRVLGGAQLEELAKIAGQHIAAAKVAAPKKVPRAKTQTSKQQTPAA